MTSPFHVLMSVMLPRGRDVEVPRQLRDSALAAVGHPKRTTVAAAYRPSVVERLASRRKAEGRKLS